MAHRSESMYAFFDEYVNSKTTLKQFMEQYESALKDKVEKDNQADFNSFNSQIPCMTYYANWEAISGCVYNCKIQRVST